MSKYFPKIAISIIVGLIISALFSWFSRAQFLEVFPGSFILISIGIFLLTLTFESNKKNNVLRWIIILGFIFRIILGMYLTINLPEIGYDEPTQNNGYLFKDAFNRDMQAWQVAKSDQPLFKILDGEFIYDQYGGLFIISTFVYKVFSPLTHNKFLVIFLAVLVSTIGISFIWKTLTFNRQIQLFGTLIYTFYPDAILFSSSQMREPFLLGLSAILFWIVMNNEMGWMKKISRGLLISALILSISTKIGIYIISFALIYILINRFPEFPKRIKSKKIIFLGIIIVIGFGFVSFRWILDVGKWDAILALSGSGWIQQIFSQLPEFLHLPFITIYGLLQPVLPASIVEPTIPVWKFLGIFRSLGWFLLSPLFLYSFIYILRINEKHKKKEWVVFFVLIAFWILLSSLRAGGDMWDNPRYRLCLLVPMSILIGTSTSYALKTRDHWLLRFFVGQLVLNLFFLQWYISRYTNIWGKLDFSVMVGIIILINVLIFGHGIYFEIKANQNKKENISV